MLPTIIAIAICSLLANLILWRLRVGQKNKYQKDQSLHSDSQRQLKVSHTSAHRELKLLLNAFDDALIITNSSGVIEIVNESTRSLCHGRALRGSTIDSAFLNQEVCKCIYDSIQSGSPVKKKLVLNDSSFGYSQTVNDSAWSIDYAPLSPRDEGLLHRIILRDITAEYRTDQIKREFVANASHELRTPLAIINGYLENLIDDDMINTPETAKKFLVTMRKHSDRISQLIDEMLTISKLESKEQAQLSIQTISLNEIVSDVIDRLNPVITAQGATINSSFNPADICFSGDPFYWSQTLFNLIENALKQNRDRAITVDIFAKITKKSTINIDICDNGKGIPSMHIPYLFNRFYRVQKHHSQNETKGTGLGLSIVKHAIEAHGGTISVHSEPGIKTTFSIQCPVK